MYAGHATWGKTKKWVLTVCGYFFFLYNLCCVPSTREHYRKLVAIEWVSECVTFMTATYQLSLINKHSHFNCQTFNILWIKQIIMSILLIQWFYNNSNRFISPAFFTSFRGVVSADNIKKTLIIFGQFNSLSIVEINKKVYHLPFTFKFRTNRVYGAYYLVKLPLIFFILKHWWVWISMRRNECTMPV